MNRIRALLDLFPPRGTVDVKTDAGRVYAHAHDQIITPALIEHNGAPDEDLTTLKSFVRPGMTVLDLGSNIGYSTLLLSSLTGPQGRVIAIEPHPDNARLLRRNLRRNRARNVTVIEAAAWHEPGTVTLSESGDNTGDHRVRALAAERTSLTVKAVRVDDVLEPDTEIGFVLADTQATEHAALAGAKRMIERCRPPMMVEFWPAGIRVFGDEPLAALATYRNEYGYRMSVLEEPGLGEDPSDEAIVAALDLRPAPYGGFGTLVMTPR